MERYDKITNSTHLNKGMIIREFDNRRKEYKYYILGEYNSDNDSFEVFPNGVDFKEHGASFYYPILKMITRDCEYLKQ